MQKSLAKTTKKLFFTASLKPILKEIIIWLWNQGLLPWSKCGPLKSWYESTFQSMTPTKSRQIRKYVPWARHWGGGRGGL